MKIEFSEFVLTSNPGTIILIKCTDLVVVGFKLVLLMDAKKLSQICNSLLEDMYHILLFGQKYCFSIL